MKCKAHITDLVQQPTACLVVGIYHNNEFPPSTTTLDKLTDGCVQKAVEKSGIEWAIGSSLLIYDSPLNNIERILLLGLGKDEELNPRNFQKLVRRMSRCLRNLQVTQALTCLSEIPIQNKSLHWNLTQQVLISSADGYQYSRTKSNDKNTRPKLEELDISLPTRADITACKAVIRESNAIAEGVEYTRELGDLPGNICTPAYLSRQARHLQQSLPIKVHILEHADLKKAGMGALLAVARGSRKKPRLIIMEYQGAPSTEQPIVLVGKGLTFDAGGISLKPGAKMDEMKYDMCGAASVLGTMQAIAKLAIPIHCIGIIPTSENLPDGNAYKPGDVITSLSGKTIEVLNTDAEGRLILCDALTYSRQFNPAVVIDIATLTGACVVALGGHASGLFSTDEELAQQLLVAGEQVHDRAWRMPLWDDYQEQLKSNFADLANVGGREGGAITAARFLSSFTEKLRWAHLDIAGTAWLSGSKKGATGRPVALLCRYLINQSRMDQTDKKSD
ncbi:MAG TPA: leucyl aminopeptidase [Gammaproteobacteria bacterium]|nr:leucyl aminopeptidase [Gammaproteobacteria bacterium]